MNRASRFSRSGHWDSTIESAKERVSTGVPRLDAMLGDNGYLPGSTVLVGGTAGAGKSTLAAQLCDRTCRRGERAFYFAFEDRKPEIVRNMVRRIDLHPWVEEGLLRFQCFSSKLHRSRGHGRSISSSATSHPIVVVIDPISKFTSALLEQSEVSAMFDASGGLFEEEGITAFFTEPGRRCDALDRTMCRSRRSSTRGCG